MYVARVHNAISYRRFTCSRDSGKFLKIVEILALLQYFYEGTAVNT